MEHSAQGDHPLPWHWASLTPKENSSLHTGIRYNKPLQPENKTKVRVQGKMSHMRACSCARTHAHTEHSSHCVRVYLKEQGSGDSFVKEKKQQPNQG